MIRISMFFAARQTTMSDDEEKTKRDLRAQKRARQKLEEDAKRHSGTKPASGCRCNNNII